MINNMIRYQGIMGRIRKKKKNKIKLNKIKKPGYVHSEKCGISTVIQ